MRGAYLNGDFQLWRVALLLVTGLVGMFFYAFGIDAISEQILPKYRKTKALVKYAGLMYVASAATLHFLVGTLAYWVTYLSEHIGREQAIAYVDDYYNLLFPAVSIVYIPTAHAHKSYIAAGRQNCHEEEHDRISHHHMAAYICAHS